MDLPHFELDAIFPDLFYGIFFYQFYEGRIYCAEWNFYCLGSLQSIM